MSSTNVTTTTTYTPFYILTSRLLILPTPSAVNHRHYLDLYASFHASTSFCTMAFGTHWLPREWDEAARKNVVESEVARSWMRRGMGDFAVGLRPVGERLGSASAGDKSLTFVEGDIPEEWDVSWIGYVGVRDASTTSMPELSPEDKADIPPWQEMIELRYGLAPTSWGHGYAPEAAFAVMQWASAHRGVRRFIAETEKLNVRSGGALKKLGFTESGTSYWGEESQIEWEKVVVR